MVNEFKKPSINQSGFTLTEVLVAAAISGLVLLSTLASVNIINSMKSQQRVQITRSEVTARIRNLVLTPGSLENSAIITNTLGANGLVPGGGSFTRFDRLLKCHPAFTDPAQTGCDRSTLDDPKKGNFVYISDRNSIDPQQTIAGEYVFYNLDGGRCTAAQATNPGQCPIFARAWAEPFCLNFAANCNKAMSIAVRYSVGVRDDYPDSARTIAAAMEGEVIVPLQKGIQITRLLDQDNNPLIPNAKGIYATQKYYGYPDQAGNPRALRFEVLVGNPTGLQSIRMQMRALTGTTVAGMDDMSIPESLSSVAWTDVPNPDDPAQPWVIPLTNAAQNQLFNFGTVNTVKGFTIGARYDLPNTDLTKQNYIYYMDPSGTSLLPPKIFKSGIYQFRVIALDTANSNVESTNYATVRIFSRPQMYLSSGTPVPPTIWRNCSSSTLNLKILTADDERLLSSNYQVLNSVGTAVASGTQSYSGTTGDFTITFDKSQPAGAYTIQHKTLNQTSNLLVRGFPLPETSTSTLPGTLTLTEITPVTDLIATPAKVRASSSASVAYSYTTGNCCSQTPTLNWTFPNVPEAGGVPMLGGDGSSPSLTCSLNAAAGTRTCTANMMVNGLVEGPTSAAPDITVDLVFSGAPQAACQVTSTATNKYFQVIKIPGIQFATNESLWVNPPAGAAGSIKATDRKVRIKADFPPADEAVTMEVRKTDGTPVCTGLTFAAGTTVDPVYLDCAIPATFSGDLVLARASANVKTSGDAPSPAWKAALVDGQLQHRVCNADLGSATGPFPLTYTTPSPLPMYNSPWGLDASGNQKPTNDTGQWGTGTTHTLRCWDTWSGFSSAYNKQDGLYSIDTYNTGKTFLSQTNIMLTPSFPVFFFPYNGAPSPDFTARNVPYFFTVSRGPASSASFQFAQSGSSTSISPGHAWTNVTSNYCSGGTSMTSLALYVNQMAGFDTATQTMKAVNSMQVGQQAGTYYSYSFVCTYGNYKPTGE